MNVSFHNNSKGNHTSFWSEKISLKSLETVGVQVNIILLRTYLSLFSFFRYSGYWKNMWSLSIIGKRKRKKFHTSVNI